MNRMLRLVSAAWLTAAGSAVGQPEPNPPPPVAPLQRDEPLSRGAEGETPPRMEEMLRRRLESIAREQKALNEALQMLERGEPTENVRRFVGDAMHDEFRQRGQGWREGIRRPPGEEPPGGAPPPLEDELGGEPPPPAEHLLEVLRETEPRMFDRLSRLRRENPGEFQRLLDDFAPRLANLARERERFPERWPDRLRLMRLQRQTPPMLRDVIESPPDARGEAMTRLRSLVGEQFDLRMKLRQADLEEHRRLDARLAKEIEDYERDRAGVVERRINEMMERAKAGPPPGGRRAPGAGPPGGPEGGV